MGKMIAFASLPPCHVTDDLISIFRIFSMVVWMVKSMISIPRAVLILLRICHGKAPNREVFVFAVLVSHIFSSRTCWPGSPQSFTSCSMSEKQVTSADFTARYKNSLRHTSHIFSPATSRHSSNINTHYGRLCSVTVEDEFGHNQLEDRGATSRQDPVIHRHSRQS